MIEHSRTFPGHSGKRDPQQLTFNLMGSQKSLTHLKGRLCRPLLAHDPALRSSISKVFHGRFENVFTHTQNTPLIMECRSERFIASSRVCVIT